MGGDSGVLAAATVAAVGGVAAALTYALVSGGAERERREERMQQMMLMTMQAAAKNNHHTSSFGGGHHVAMAGGSPPVGAPPPATPPQRRRMSATQHPITPSAAAGTFENVPALMRANSIDYTHVVPSMEDLVKEQEEEGEIRAKLTPQDVLISLQQGNSRFWMGLATRPEKSAMERRAMIMRQFPKVAVLGCSDSRVPIEIVFDQGLGDVFAIRVAGNACGTGATASIDYAVAHLNVPLVLVLGHEGCGAVRAAQLSNEELSGEPPALKSWLTTMKQDMAAQHKDLDVIRDRRARDREAVITNVRAQIAALSRNKLIQRKVKAGELLVVGAFYEITSGMVDFMEPEAFCDDCDDGK